MAKKGTKTRPSKTADNAQMMDMVRQNEAEKWKDMMAELELNLEAAKSESHAAGILRKIRYDNQHNEMLRFAVLYQIKQEKGYKKGGQTWQEFCESVGEDRRRVDETLKDMRPIYDKFSAEFAGLINLPFNKVKYLGRSFSADSANFADGRLIIGDEDFEVSPENLEDITAAITAMQEREKEQRKKLRKKIDRLEKSKDRLVKEETLALETERNEVVKELKALKAKIPEAPDGSWFKKEAEKIKDHAATLSVMCRNVINANRDKLSDDRMAQGAVAAYIEAGVGMLEDLMKDFRADFPLFEEDAE